MPAPATSAICSTASATACRCCRPQHRHHLAAEAGRYRQVDRQPGAAAADGLQHQSPALHSPARAPRSGQQVRHLSSIFHQQAQRWCFHVHQCRGHRCDNHDRHGCLALQLHEDKTATVKTLDQLNTALAVAGVNLSASITNTDELTFTSTNDGAAQTITGTTAAVAPSALDAINISANALGGGAGGNSRCNGSDLARCRKPRAPRR